VRAASPGGVEYLVAALGERCAGERARLEDDEKKTDESENDF
jgi:hypothetical protein